MVSFNPKKLWLALRDKFRRQKEVSQFQLREFIYLDEVSLQSLLVSLHGELTEKKSITDSTSNTRNVSGNIDTNNLAPLKLGFTAQYQSGKSSATQTETKATVQSWFRELYETPNILGVQPLEDGDQDIIVKSSALQRGTLAELQVVLATDPYFNVVTSISEFFKLSENISELNGYSEIKWQIELLQQLLAGLIPIKAEILNYRALKTGDDTYLVHEDKVTGVSTSKIKVNLVGVTELSAYWKDIRRVLFSNQEFRVLCRISHPGLVQDWNPIKLLDLFGNVFPQKEIHNVKEILKLLSYNVDAASTAETDNDASSKMRLALEEYIKSSCEHAGGEIGSDEVECIIEEVLKGNFDEGSMGDRKVLYEKVDGELASLKIDVPPDIRVTLRESSSEKAGLSHKLFTLASSEAKKVEEKSVAEELFIEAEIIAIYW
ncbi:hypothetical protein [uncultured Corynebacterium sp.]|uniref:DUF6414 family protein n=1 Tax=uncultured Corynebacterium sp. TaxID=159447 RepID=UPI0028EE0D90|nr:hypothetical protein [uncultured Corynebacterium sp.]